MRRERIFLLGEVAPDHRGQGVGRELLAWSLKRARARLHSRTHSLPKYICVDAESWQKTVRGHGGRPDLSVIAIDRATDEVIGVCLTHAYPEDDKVAGLRQAWINNLATVGRWRGRGLASAMIAESLKKFTSAGFTYALIGVDADNPTGAARLYRALGFQPLHRSTAYQMEMPDPPRSTRSRGEESSAMPGA